MDLGETTGPTGSLNGDVMLKFKREIFAGTVSEMEAHVGAMRGKNNRDRAVRVKRTSGLGERRTYALKSRPKKTA